MIDFTGIKISGHIIFKVSERFEQLKIDDSIQIRTDNYKAIQSDLISWSNMTGNKVILINNNGNNLTFAVTKITDKVSNGKSFSIIISDRGLEELLSPRVFCRCCFEWIPGKYIFSGTCCKSFGERIQREIKRI